MKLLRAFTLIELLVVIVIIAILAGLALPVYNNVLEKGRATEDASNLRQLGIGALAYANDNDDFIFAVDPADTNSVWPKMLNPRYIQTWKVFKSPFDPRAKTETEPAPVSYGVNTNVLATSTGKFTNSSSLILMAPAPNPTTDLAFNGVSSQNVTISKPATATPTYGTHGNRGRLNVLFGDFHIESISYKDYASSTNKVVWLP